MPGIKCQRADKSQKLLWKQYVSKESTEPYKYRIAKFFSIRELKVKYISHTKGHSG